MLRILRRLRDLEARVAELESHRSYELPPRYDLGEPVDVDGMWRASVEDRRWYTEPVDEWGGYL